MILLLCPLNSIKVKGATIIFSDNFQNGSLSAWTQYRGTLTPTSQTTNNGEPYSVSSIIPVGSSGNLYFHALSPTSVTNPIDIREYVYINSTTQPATNGNYYQVGGFSDNVAPDQGDGELIVMNVGGTLYWGVYYRDTIKQHGLYICH